MSLPAEAMADTAVGGGSARWPGAGEARVSFEKGAGGMILSGKICGRPARILLDARAEGPIPLSAAWAAGLPEAFQPDVRGRAVARCGPIEAGGLSFPTLFVQRSDSLPPGVDAAIGAAFLRETVVEIDPAGGTVSFSPPSSWVSPAGFFRGLLDDDGNRPVAILRKGKETLRLLSFAPVPVPFITR